MRDRAQILEAAADLVEQGWCRGVSARGENGKRVRIDSEDAVAWCAAGAITRVAGRSRAKSIQHKVGEMLGRQTIWGYSLAAWNDAPTQTQANVATSLRKIAKELAEQRKEAAA